MSNLVVRIIKHAEKTYCRTKKIIGHEEAQFLCRSLYPE